MRDVAFIGGDPNTFASVRIRCLDIAKKLKSDYYLNKHYAHEIPDRYSKFVCIKPSLWPGELKKLARRGKIVWDVIDSVPPRMNVAVYLVSTAMAGSVFGDYGKVAVIPHHHCNFGGVPNSDDRRRPAWIGSLHWFPGFQGFEYDLYDVKNMSRLDVLRAHRRIGIGLNFRTDSPKIYLRKYQQLGFDFHVAINSGIKLINCLGFGIPSISSNEPAYHEIGLDCSVLSDLKKCAYWVRILQNENALYSELRANCLKKAKNYHLNAIARDYIDLLRSI